MQAVRAIGRYIFTAICFLWTGGKLVLDWLGRGLSAADAASSEGFTAKGLAIVLHAPWWAPVAIWSIAALFLAYISRRDFLPPVTNSLKSAMPEKDIRTSDSQLNSSSNAIKKRNIIDGHFVQIGKDEGLIWEFRAVSDRTVKTRVVYVEVSRAQRGLLLRKLKIAQFANMQKGESFTIPLISMRQPHDKYGLYAWFGNYTLEDKSFSHPIVVGL